MLFHEEHHRLSALLSDRQLTIKRFVFSASPSDGELYSGTAYNFLGSEPIISRYSPSQSLLRTEYSTSWLNGELGCGMFLQHNQALTADHMS